MRKDPKVSLLFSNPEGSGIEKHVVLVQGVADCDDSDLDHGWERYLPMWRKKEPYIDGFLAAREQFAWFWKRMRPCSLSLSAMESLPSGFANRRGRSR